MIRTKKDKKYHTSRKRPLTNDKIKSSNTSQQLAVKTAYEIFNFALFVSILLKRLDNLVKKIIPKCIYFKIFSYTCLIWLVK